MNETKLIWHGRLLDVSIKRVPFFLMKNTVKRFNNQVEQQWKKTINVLIHSLDQCHYRLNLFHFHYLQKYHALNVKITYSSGLAM